MGFNPSGGAISGASDVAFNNPADNQALTFDSSIQKWTNEMPAGGDASSVDIAPIGNSQSTNVQEMLEDLDSRPPGITQAYTTVKLIGETALPQRNTLEIIGGALSDDSVAGITRLDVSTFPATIAVLDADFGITNDGVANIVTVSGQGELAFDVKLGEEYFIQACLNYRVGADTGMKWQLSGNSGTSFTMIGSATCPRFNAVGAAGQRTVTVTASDSTAYPLLDSQSVGNGVLRYGGGYGTGTTASLVLHGIRIIVNAVPAGGTGKVLIKVGQGVTNATETTGRVMANSWMLAARYR